MSIRIIMLDMVGLSNQIDCDMCRIGESLLIGLFHFFIIFDNLQSSDGDLCLI